MQILLSVYDLSDAAGEEIDRAQEARDRITCRLPGLQMLLTGSLSSGIDSWGTRRQLPGASEAKVPSRGELLIFKCDLGAADALCGPVGQELAEHSATRLSNVRTFSAHGQAVVPFDSRKPGSSCRMTIAGLVYNADYGTFEQTEHHYVAEHTRLAGRLPGCQAYFIGIVERDQNVPQMPNDPYRLALGVFDDEATLRRALRGPAAADLEQDAQSFAKVAMLYFLDAQIRL